MSPRSSTAYNPDARINGAQRTKNAEAAQRSMRQLGIEHLENTVPVLSSWEREEIRGRLCAVQLEGDSVGSLRAQRLLTLLDLAENAIARQVAVEAGVESASDLNDAVETCTEAVKEACKASLTEKIADLLQDNPAATPAEIAAWIGDMHSDAMAEAAREAKDALDALTKAVEDHAVLMKGLSDAR